jgi:isoquinoline 1-oxidoreductase
MILGDTDLCPWDRGTWGSLTTRAFGPAMRAAAAEGKAVLLELASEKFKVPVAQLEVTDGVVRDTKNSANAVTYAQLAKGKRIERFLDTKPPVEDYSKFNIVGKPFKHQDGVDKVTGYAKFAGDYKLKGMVFARILRPPSHGAKLKSADYSAAEKIEGCQVIKDGDLIAVISENQEVAWGALGKIKADYSFNEILVNDKTIFERILKTEIRENVRFSNGDPDTGFQASDIILESEFHDPYLAHAPIETHTALAHIEKGKLTVWASTQNPFGLQEELARELKLSLEKVRVITPFVGGGFGGKSSNPQAVEAAKLARLSAKPVMVMYTRDEEFFYDRFHPAGVIKVKAGIDNNGLIKAWEYRSFFAGTRGAEVIYDVPDYKVIDCRGKENTPPVHPFYTGAWRAPNNNTNTFARESQIDILAKTANMDPLEFRLKNLKDQKMTACLQAVADKFGYFPGKGKNGRGKGIALGIDAGTWVAMIAEVEVDRETGKVQVNRIVCVQDMGLCVNPQGATIQMEGCIMMGLGYTFTEEVFFEGGNILNRSFGNYPIPRFSWLTKIETHILDRKDQPPQGGGEPAIITVGAAIGNAIADATGARLYRMPFTPERVLEALKVVKK